MPDPLPQVPEGQGEKPKQAPAQTPEEARREEQKTEVREKYGDDNLESNADSLMKEIQSLRGVENIHERREKFMQLVNVLQDKPDDFFQFSQQNFQRLANVVIAFNTNGSFENGEDLDTAKEVELRISRVIATSAGIDESKIGEATLSAENFTNPSYLSINVNLREEGDTSTVDQYYLRANGEVDNKEVSWDHNPNKKENMPER